MSERVSDRVSITPSAEATPATAFDGGPAVKVTFNQSATHAWVLGLLPLEAERLGVELIKAAQDARREWQA